MFFILSKILAFLTSPINWITLLVLFGLFTRRAKWRKRSLIAAGVFFFVFTNGFIARKAMYMLEVEAIGTHELKSNYELGILLGGMTNVRSDTNKVNFNSNGDRLFQTMDLYASGRINKILISSGSGEVQLQSFKEAALVKRYLVKIGIPEEDVITEIKSRNTFENAVECSSVIDALYGSDYQDKSLLITSASHMRRAMKCFKKQQVNVVAYSTIKRAEKGPFIFRSEMILPNPQALVDWKVILHETAGLFVYRIRGYI